MIATPLTGALAVVAGWLAIAFLSLVPAQNAFFARSRACHIACAAHGAIHFARDDEAARHRIASGPCLAAG